VHPARLCRFVPLGQRTFDPQVKGSENHRKLPPFSGTAVDLFKQQIPGFRHSASKPDLLSILDDVLVNLAGTVVQLGKQPLVIPQQKAQMVLMIARLDDTKILQAQRIARIHDEILDQQRQRSYRDMQYRFVHERSTVMLFAPVQEHPFRGNDLLTRLDAAGLVIMHVLINFL
jgi:hypothetical protein